MEFFAFLDSPLGPIKIKANEESVLSIGFESESGEENANAISAFAKKQLQEYFAGTRLKFDLPVKQEGTDFQQKVWQCLSEIPVGSTLTYAAFSKRMKNPLAIRAIAAANGKNKLMIVVPCHRVIGSTGELVGYAGELWRKKWLLEHEAKISGIGQANLFL